MASPNLLTNASAVPRLLCSQQIVGTSETTVYTVPVGCGVSVTHGTLCNVTGSAVTVSLSLVPSGGSADTTHRLISQLSLPANDSQSLRNYLADAKLGEGDFVSVLAGTANAVDVVLSGVVLS